MASLLEADVELTPGDRVTTSATRGIVVTYCSLTKSIGRKSGRMVLVLCDDGDVRSIWEHFLKRVGD
jgi:hypothetical protein